MFFKVTRTFCSVTYDFKVNTIYHKRFVVYKYNDAIYLAGFVLDVKWCRKPRVCAHGGTVNNIMMKGMAFETFEQVHLPWFVSTISEDPSEDELLSSPYFVVKFTKQSRDRKRNVVCVHSPASVIHAAGDQTFNLSLQKLESAFTFVMLK